MSWVIHKGKRYWFGLLDPQGLVIYDPSAQPQHTTLVSLFGVTARKQLLFEKETIRSRISSCRELLEERVTSALGSYLGDGDLPRETPVASSQTASQKRLHARHQRFLTRHNRAIAMIRMIPSRQAGGGQYRNNCFKCNSLVGKSSEIWKCSACGWTICECGACGCGFKGKQK